MAIVPFVAPFLFTEAQRAPFDGKLLQLGRQAILFDRAELRATAELCGFTLHNVPETPLVAYEFGPDRQVITDQEFFGNLGFDIVDGLDFIVRTPRDIVLDLNSTKTPLELQEQYDVILDGGTLEHIFHVPNALKHIHQLLKPGGRVLHFVPASNQMEHGFYSFSPCFFVDYYTRNNYELITIKLIRTDPLSPLHNAKYLDVFPDHENLRQSLQHIGGLDDGIYLLHIVARKRADSLCGEIPLQGCYQPRVTSSMTSETEVNYHMENGKWVFPWQPVPCFNPQTPS